MPLFFNLEELLKFSGGSSVKFMDILRDYYFTVSNKGHYNNKYSVNIKGTSYLLRPLELIDYNIYVDYKVQYVKLASLRDYTLYKLFNDKSLNLSYYPEIDAEKLKHNKLLTIKNNKVYFKLEEI